MTGFPTTYRRSIGFYMNAGLSLVFALMACLLIGHQYWANRQMALENATEKARLILDRNLAIHTYFSHRLKPDVFAMSDPYRSSDFFAPSWMSSTYAVREIDKLFNQMQAGNYYYKECAVNARSPENDADDFERAFIEESNRNASLVERSVVRTINGKPYLALLRRGEVMKEACLRCHSTPDRAPGGLLDVYGAERSFGRNLDEVISAISIRIPLEAAYENADDISLHHGLFLLAGLFSLYGLQYLIFKRYVSIPIKILQDKIVSVAAQQGIPAAPLPLPATSELHDITGAFNSMLARLQNIQENLEAEIQRRTAALLEEKNFLDTLLDTLEEGIVVCNADGVLTRFNKSTEKLQGLPMKNLPAEEWAQHYDLYLADGVTPMKKEEVPLFRALQGEHVRDAEMMIMPKKGAARRVVANGRPLRSSDGTIIGAVASMHDITEWKQAADALHHSHELMRYIIEHSRSAIAVLDRDLKYVYVSRRFLEDYRVPEEDVIGKGHYDVFPDLPQIYKDVHQKALAGEVLRGDNDPYEREDGSVDWARWECRPWHEPDGSIGGIILSMEIVTELKKREDELTKLADELDSRVLERTLDLAETQNALLNLLDDVNLTKEELEQANKRLQELDRLKSMFIASMSHELRTPLNSVIGFSSILLDEWLGPLNDEQKINLAAIQRSGKHLLSLINDVIDISKIEAGTLEPQIDEFDLRDVLSEAADYMKKQAEDKGLRLTVHECSHRMRTDRRRLLQILINFLSNGVKFTDTGEVTLSARLLPEENNVEISVTDTGIGIRQADMEKLFLPFSRLHDSGTSVYPGTGLGLYLCRKIAQEILGGEVKVKSIFGQGSTFYVIIPARINR